jgi:alkyl hydroperoxide reductase subunit AhpC
MEEKVILVGQQVPDFEMETYEPSTGKFGKFSLADAKKEGKWTILFFYPADFTFVCPTELADLAEKYEELKTLELKLFLFLQIQNLFTLHGKEMKNYLQT